MASHPFRVVIAGGGVAALEAALALQELAGDRVATTIVAPNEEFVYRPLAVHEPFATGRVPRYPIAPIAEQAGATLIADELASVAPASRTILTRGGQTVGYEALILCLGARTNPAYPFATTLDDRRFDEQLHGLVQDIEGGYVKSVAFVSPHHMAWPLPLYELALMTSARAREMGIDVEISLTTPEAMPLAIFGPEASRTVAAVLANANISVATSAYASVPDANTVAMIPGTHRFHADRIVALPDLFGPAVRGLSAGERGFIPVDPGLRVRGTKDIYAAGDATDFPVKFGGIAALQADTVARSIAARVGANVTEERFVPEIHGVLATGGKPLYLSARIAGGRGLGSVVSGEPEFAAQRKIAARYLGPVLERLDAQVAAG